MSQVLPSFEPRVLESQPRASVTKNAANALRPTKKRRNMDIDLRARADEAWRRQRCTGGVELHEGPIREWRREDRRVRTSRVVATRGHTVR
jgi:hypothetical protein